MRKLPPLNALRAFEAAARHMSFAKAADELAVTPGQELFRRRPRPITLTEAGERLFPVLRDGLDRFAMAVAGLRADADRSPLIVSTTTAFASRWLVPRLAKLADDIDLVLEIDASETPANLRSGTADFAIRYRRTPISDLECHELVRDRFVPVMSPVWLTTHLSTSVGRGRIWIRRHGNAFSRRRAPSIPLRHGSTPRRGCASARNRTRSKRPSQAKVSPWSATSWCSANWHRVRSLKRSTFPSMGLASMLPISQKRRAAVPLRVFCSGHATR